MIIHDQRKTTSILNLEQSIFPDLDSQIISSPQNAIAPFQEARDYLANRSVARRDSRIDLSDPQSPIKSCIETTQTEYTHLNKFHAFDLKAAKANNSPSWDSKDLLWAASMDDAQMLKEIYYSGASDINVIGKFGETPLHIAAITGNLAAIDFLLRHGADANITAYEDYKGNGYTAFDLALVEENVDIIMTMYLHNRTGDMSKFELFEYAVEHNVVELVQLMMDKGTHLGMSSMDIEDLAWDKVFDLIDMSEKINSDADYEIFEKIGSTLELLAPLSGTVIGVGPWIDFEIPPMSVFLEIYAFDTPDPRVHDLLMDTAQRLDSIDGNKSPYLMAKALFHILPIEGLFKIDYNNVNSHHSKKAYIEGEGFYHLYTVPLAHAAVKGFLEDGPINSAIQMKTFQSTLNTLTTSSEYADKLGLASTAQAFYDAFQNGETILLPSGWSGHAVDIIANKNQNILIIANNGNRYDDLDSGVNIFMMPQTNLLTPEIIHDILVNQNQIDLELKLSAKLGLFGYDSIIEPDQFTGNCAWQSHESAIEGVLYINLLEQGLNTTEAKTYAHEYYQAWDVYQTTSFIEGYFNDDPRISSEAITALIKTQAFLLETDDIHVLKADPIGHILITTYEDMTHKNADSLKLDYDPFAEWDMLPLSWGEFGQSDTNITLTSSDILQESSELIVDLVDVCPLIEPMIAPSLPQFCELESQDMAMFG